MATTLLFNSNIFTRLKFKSTLKNYAIESETQITRNSYIVDYNSVRIADYDGNKISN